MALEETQGDTVKTIQIALNCIIILEFIWLWFSIRGIVGWSWRYRTRIPRSRLAFLTAHEACDLYLKDQLSDKDWYKITRERSMGSVLDGDLESQWYMLFMKCTDIPTFEVYPPQHLLFLASRQRKIRKQAIIALRLRGVI